MRAHARKSKDPHLPHRKSSKSPGKTPLLKLSLDYAFKMLGDDKKLKKAKQLLNFLDS